MKTFIFFLVFLVSSSFHAYAQPVKNPTFVRIYNMEGKKINKGTIYSISESSLQLTTKKGITEINLIDIGLIKTKHSEGNNILWGSTIGASTLALAGAASASPDDWLGWTAGEGVAAGIIFGAPIGGAIGGLTILFKKSDTYIINGQASNWGTFKEGISK